MTELFAVLGSPWYWRIVGSVAAGELVLIVLLVVRRRVRNRGDRTTWVELRRADNNTWTEHPLTTREIRRLRNGR